MIKLRIFALCIFLMFSTNVLADVKCAPTAAILVDLMPCFDNLGYEKFADIHNEDKDIEKVENNVYLCQYKQVKKSLSGYKYIPEIIVYFRLENNWVELAGNVGIVLRRSEEIIKDISGDTSYIKLFMGE